MTDYDDFQQRIVNAQMQWEHERSAVHVGSTPTGSAFEGEMEPPSILGPDNYDTMTSRQLVEAVSGMDAGTVHAVGDTWLSIGSKVRDAAEAFNNEFRKTVDGNGGQHAWGGVAADRAVASVYRYAGRCEMLAAAGHLVGVRLTEMATGMSQTKALMPGTVDHPDLRGEPLPAEGILKEGDFTEEETENEARRILRTVYSQVAQQCDHNVPVLPDSPMVLGDDCP